MFLSSQYSLIIRKHTRAPEITANQYQTNTETGFISLSDAFFSDSKVNCMHSTVPMPAHLDEAGLPLTLHGVG